MRVVTEHDARLAAMLREQLAEAGADPARIDHAVDLMLAEASRMSHTLGVSIAEVADAMAGIIAQAEASQAAPAS